MATSVRGGLGLTMCKAAVLGAIAVLWWKPVRAADFALPSPVETTRQATMEASDLKRKIKQMYDALHAVHVRYVQETSDKSPSSQRIPRMSFNYAYKGEKRLKGQAEPDGNYHTFVFTGDVQQLHDKNLNQVTISKRKELHADIDAYIYVLGIPMQESERATAPESSYFLPFCLDNGDWRVLPMLQLVDGQECHVLESGNGLRLWVDSDLGVIRYREIFQQIKDRDPAEWPIFARHYFTRHVECGDGIRLPMLVKVDAFNSARAPEQNWGKISYQTVMNVEEIRVNDDVSDDLFILKLTDSTEVMDTINNRMSKIGDLVGGLDAIIDGERERNAGRNGWSGRGVLLWLIAIAIVMLVVLIIVRRWLMASK